MCVCVCEGRCCYPLFVQGGKGRGRDVTEVLTPRLRSVGVGRFIGVGGWGAPEGRRGVALLDIYSSASRFMPYRRLHFFSWPFPTPPLLRLRAQPHAPPCPPVRILLLLARAHAFSLSLVLLPCACVRVCVCVRRRFTTYVCTHTPVTRRAGSQRSARRHTFVSLQATTFFLSLLLPPFYPRACLAAAHSLPAATSPTESSLTTLSSLYRLLPNPPRRHMSVTAASLVVASCVPFLCLLSPRRIRCSLRSK